MGTDEMESTGTELEGGETEVSTPSEEVQETSSETTEAESEETPESKKEESFEDKVDRLAQSKADKVYLQTYQKKIEKMTAEKEALTLQLNEKILNLTSNDMYGEEVENLGEEDADKRKAARETRNKMILEFQKDAALVAKQKPLLAEREASLNIVERTQGVREKLWPLFFPEEKKDITAYTEALKRFDKASDWDDVAIILEGIREGLKNKTRKFVSDSGQQGGGGVDLSKLSTEDKLVRALREMDKRK